MGNGDETADAVWLKARRYALGDTVPTDMNRAVELMRDAARLQLESGEGNFAFQLGRNLATGIYYSDREDECGAPRLPDIKRDLAEANSWFEKAADAGYWPADSWVELRSNGLGDDEILGEMCSRLDDNWAFADHPWLLAACRLGDAEACMDLAFSIWDRWPWQAYHWEERVSAYRKGRELGHRHRAILWTNEGKSASRELQLMKAKAGYLPAQMDMGTRYAGSAEHIEAFAWLKTAFSNESRWGLRQTRDYRDARSALWFLERVLDDKELASAEALASSYTSKYRPRRVGIIRRLKWLADDWNDLAAYLRPE